MQTAGVQIFSLLRVGIYVFVLTGSPTSSALTIDERLSTIVDRSNADFPKMVGPNIRQEKARYGDRTLTYSYTHLTLTATETAKLDLNRRSHLVPVSCQDPFTRRLLREGISLRYLYFGRDGKVAGDVLVQKRDCGL